MAKRRPALDPRQIGFTFEAPVMPRRAADLAGLDRQVSAAVGIMLKDDPRSREEIAGAVSALLDEPVTKYMLDAYASEAREGHAVSAARLFALVAVTNRHDLLDALMRKIGASILVGEEIDLARMGDIKSRITALAAELKQIERRAVPMKREGRR